MSVKLCGTWRRGHKDSERSGGQVCSSASWTLNDPLIQNQRNDEQMRTLRLNIPLIPFLVTDPRLIKTRGDLDTFLIVLLRSSISESKSNLSSLVGLFCPFSFSDPSLS